MVNKPRGHAYASTQRLVKRFSLYGIRPAPIRHIMKIGSLGSKRSALHWLEQTQGVYGDSGTLRLACFLHGCGFVDETFSPEIRVNTLVDMGIRSGSYNQSEMPDHFCKNMGYILRHGAVCALEKGISSSSVLETMKELGFPDISLKYRVKYTLPAAKSILEYGPVEKLISSVKDE